MLYRCPGQRQSLEELATGCSQLHPQDNISRLRHRCISDTLLARSAWDRRIKSKLSTGNLHDKTWWQTLKAAPQIFPRWSTPMAASLHQVAQRQITWLPTSLLSVVLGTTTSVSTTYRTRCSCLLRTLHSVVFISVFTQSGGIYHAWMPLKLQVQMESLHGY